MNQWDWIQWYYGAMLTISVGAALLLHGSPKVGHHDFRYTFIALGTLTPVIGRIFGWW